jgi:glycosyltransferase involved in cell wall biosynthesis
MTDVHGSFGHGTERLRVLLVNAHGDDPSSGGAERAVLDLGRQLGGFDVDVRYLQAFPQRLPGNDVPRTVLHRTDWRDDSGRRLRNHIDSVLAVPSLHVQRAIADHRPHVVHTHNLPGIGTGVWEVARRLGRPVIHTIWDYYLLCPRVTLMTRDGKPCRPSPWLCGYRSQRLTRWAPAVSHVIGCSQYVNDSHADVFSHAEKHVLRNPVDSPEGASIRGPRHRLEVIGYIGSLERIKGVHLLLGAAAGLRSLGVRLRIAGDGKLREEVDRAASTHPNVESVGPVLGEAKTRFFEECDLGVVPSVWAEPGGPTFTMAEWLGAGRPVLVSNRGGLGEVAGRYPGSLPIEPSVDSLIAKVSRLLEPGLWPKVVDDVRPIRDAALGLEAWTRKHVDLYRAVAGGGDGSC